MSPSCGRKITSKFSASGLYLTRRSIHPRGSILSDRIPLLMIFSQSAGLRILFAPTSLSSPSPIYLSIYLSTPSTDSIYLFIYYLSPFVPPISKQIPFASGIIRPVLLAYPENKDTIERYRPPICSDRKSASRAALINVNLALSEIARSTSARFMMKTLSIIAFTYNVPRQFNNFYTVILLLRDYTL